MFSISLHCTISPHRTVELIPVSSCQQLCSELRWSPLYSDVMWCDCVASVAASDLPAGLASESTILIYRWTDAAAAAGAVKALCSTLRASRQMHRATAPDWTLPIVAPLSRLHTLSLSLARALAPGYRSTRFSWTSDRPTGVYGPSACCKSPLVSVANVPIATASAMSSSTRCDNPSSVRPSLGRHVAPASSACRHPLSLLHHSIADGSYGFPSQN